MGGLGVILREPVGFVDLDHVWLDDRMNCRWGLEDLSVVVVPGETVVLLDDRPSAPAAHAVLDLIAGRRRAVRGTVSIDGVRLHDLAAAAHSAAVTELLEPGPGGERRLVVAGRTELIADPRPLSLVAADRVVVLAHGTVVAEGPHRELMAAGGRYARRFAEVAAA